jgi:nicotinate-nucleotide adenylyltransferase
MTMKETIIYGGAFCPPTKAHQAILQACIDYAEPRNADVWLLPSANREDKMMSMDSERRIELCEALCRDVMKRTVNLSISTMELDRQQLTETYDTVRELDATHPDRAFIWVFGADSVATMPTWDHGDELFNNLPMLVVGRSGTRLKKIGNKAIWLPVETGDESSTEVRRRMQAGEDYDDMVSEQVRALLVAPMVR